MIERISVRQTVDPLLDHVPEETVHEESQSWLTGYASLLTVLVGLFAILLSFSNLDSVHMANLQKSASQTFGGSYSGALAPFATFLDAQLKQLSALKGVQVHQIPEGIEIQFQTGDLFVPGSAILKPDAQHQVEILADLIKQSRHEFNVTVEGHTDRSPVVKQKWKFDTNWELSGARAFNIVRLFEKAGIPSHRLAGMGYGSARPLAKELTYEALKKNRRVGIKLVQVNPSLTTQ